MKKMKKGLSLLLCAIMVLGTVAVGFGGLLSMKASAANNSKTLNIIANTSGDVLDNKAGYMNLWQTGGAGSYNANQAAEAPLDFVEYIEIMNATGGGDGTNGSTNRDLIDKNSGAFKQDMLVSLTNTIDTICSLGAKPLIKLGGMPFYFTKTSHPNWDVESAMSANPYPPDADASYTTVYYNAGTTGTGYDAYRLYISDVIQYLVNKYGSDEVKTWRWGVYTEYENHDWAYTESDKNLSNGSTRGNDSADAFMRIYDYTVKGVTDILGDSNTYIGAHSMTVSEGIWDEAEFIKHIAYGVNYAEGDTDLTIKSNRHGVHCDYLAASFYDTEAGVYTSGKSLVASINYLRDKAENYATSALYLAEVSDKSKETLLNLEYGIDEGRILQGASGSTSNALNSRTVGYTWQAAYDARMYYQMIEEDIDYFCSWSFTSNTIGKGFPAITYHVAQKTAEMAGDSSYLATVSDGSGVQNKNTGLEYNAYATYNTSDSKMRVMAYNFKNNLSYSDKSDLTLNVTLPDSFKNKNVKVWKYAIDDTANFFDDWQRDYTANGITKNQFSWSPDDPEIESYNTLDGADGRRLLDANRDKYVAASKLTPTADILSVDSTGKVTITDNDMQANSAVYYVIEETNLLSETHYVFFDVNDGKTGVNLFAPPASADVSGVSYTYDDSTNIMTFNGTASRSTTNETEKVNLFDVPIPYAMKQSGYYWVVPEGVSGGVSGGAIVFELYKNGKNIKEINSSVNRCNLDASNANTLEPVQWYIPSNAIPDTLKVFVYMPEGVNSANINDFSLRLKIEKAEDGSSENSQFSPNAKLLNGGDVYGNLSTPSRDDYKFTCWKNGSATITSTSSFNTGSDVTLKAQWEAAPACDVYFNVNHDNIGVNVFKPNNDTFTYTPSIGGVGSISYSYNQTSGVITLNGKISGLITETGDDNNHYLLTIPFTPTNANISMSVDWLSGTISNTGTSNPSSVVIDIVEETQPSLDRYNIDARENSTDKSFTILNYTNFKNILFWVWCDGSSFTLDNVKIKVKVENSLSKTAYSPDAKKITQGSPYGILQEPYREGWKFDGWFTAASGGTKIDASSVAPQTITQTLYAHWTQTAVYTVTFDKQGGSGGVDSAKVTQEVTPQTIASVPSKSGYEFGGYYTAPNGQGKCCYDSQGNGTAPYTEGKNATLYAYWISSSSVSETESTGSKAYFNVPECIYLTPSTGTGSTAFQYVVDQTLNTSDGSMTLNAGEKAISSGGIIEFYTSDSTITSVNISWSLYNDSTTGLSATVGGTTAAQGTKTVSTKTDGKFKTTITAGSLGANVGDKTILWEASYVKDGVVYTFFNYTYIYKPFVSPVYAATRCYNDRTSSNYAIDLQSIAWITGIQGSTDNGNARNNTAKFDPINNIVLRPVSSNSGNDDSKDPGRVFYSTDVISSSQTNAYHTSTSLSNGNGQFTDADSGDNADLQAQAVSPFGSLTVDKSRISNLDQVPNLKVGFIISYSKEGKNSYNQRRFGYYLSDYPSSIVESSSSNSQGGASNYYFDNRGTYFGSYYDVTHESDESKDIGTDYSRARTVADNISWNKDISGYSTGKIRIAIKAAVRYGARYSYLGNKNINSNESNIVRVELNVVNKSSLRSAVQTAISSVNCYSNLTAGCKEKYIKCLNEACLCLGKPDTDSSDINNAISALDNLEFTYQKGTVSYSDYKRVADTDELVLANSGRNSFNFGSTVNSTAGNYSYYTLDSTEVVENLFNAEEFVAANYNETSSYSCVTSCTTFGNNGIKLEISSTEDDNYTTMPYWNGKNSEFERRQYIVAVQPETTYVLSADLGGTTGSWQMFAFYIKADGTANSSFGCSSTNGTSVEFITPSDCYFLSFRFGNKETGTKTVTFDNIKLTRKTSRNVPISNCSDYNVEVKRIYNPYEYTVVYDANGGTGTVPASQTKYYGTPINLASSNLTKTGAKQVGWNTKADCTGVSYSFNSSYDGYTANNNDTITLYADWEWNKASTLVIDSNGGKSQNNLIYFKDGKLSFSYSGTNMQFTGSYNSDGTVKITGHGEKTGAEKTPQFDGMEVYLVKGHTYEISFNAKSDTQPLDQSPLDFYVYKQGTGMGCRSGRLKNGIYQSDGTYKCSATFTVGGTGTDATDRTWNNETYNNDTYNLTDVYNFRISMSKESDGDFTMDNVKIIEVTQSEGEDNRIIQLGGTTREIPNPVRQGYIFDGWNLSGAGSLNGTTYTFAEDDTLLTAKWLKLASDDVFVLDSSLTVNLDLSKNDAEGYKNVSGISTSIDGSFVDKITNDNYEASLSNGKVQFKAKNLTEKTVFCYKTNTNDGCFGTATVTIIPATSVYYEEDSNYISFGGTWTTLIDPKSATSADYYAKRAGEAINSSYGALDAYTNDNSSIYSMGHAKYVEVSKDANNKDGKIYASFTFTGTGFEVYSITNSDSGYLTYTIKNNSDNTSKTYALNTYHGYEYGRLYLDGDQITLGPDGTQLFENEKGNISFGNKKLSTTGTVEAFGWIPTVSDTTDNSLYQIPVIRKTGLDYGSYTVTITPKYSSVQDMHYKDKSTAYKFYIDGVKILDPINPSTIEEGSEIYDAYFADRELNATTQMIREILIEGGSVSGISTGVAFLEKGKNDGKLDFTTYRDIGPKTEVYLEPGQIIAFNLTTADSVAPAKVSVGVKLLKEGSGEVTINENKISLNCTTESFKNIAVNWVASNGKFVTESHIIIKNSGNSNIALTDIKWSYGKNDVSAKSRAMLFSVGPDILGQAAELEERIKATESTVTYDGVSVEWDSDKIELGEKANLIITAPKEIIKATLDGEELAGYEILENGSKRWTYTLDSNSLGNYEYTVVLYDENGCNSKPISSGVCKIVEPTVDIDDAVIGWDKEEINIGESATLTVETNEKITAVTIGEERISEFTLENGRKTFKFVFNAEAIGDYKYTVVLEEAHGYQSKSKVTKALKVKGYYVNTDDIDIRWISDTVETGAKAQLVIKTPADVEKVIVDGNELIDCKILESGEKEWTFEIVVEKTGEFEYSIRFEDKNGMISSSVSTGVLKVEIPEETPGENTGEGENQGEEKLTFWQKLVRFIKKLFAPLVTFVKGLVK